MAQKHPHPEHEHLPDNQPREKELHHDKQPHSVLEKEFELERMILFSDAVFAIAITLMVIDIKWPEIPESLKGVDLSKLFRPTIFQFIVFTVSFLYIGRAWSEHLRLFRLLKNYDQGLIKRNLRFLFFIIIFPFTASGMFGHIKPDFMFPLFLYIFNVAAVGICHFLIIRYVFREKTGLSVAGAEMEKKYIYIKGRNNALGMLVIFIILILVAILFPGKNNYFGYVFLLLPPFIFYTNRKARKYKPTTTTPVK